LSGFLVFLRSNFFHFEWVIPCHDGEDSENWDAFYYPLADARKALRALAELLETGRSV
jgi:guanylate kinase